MRKKILTGVLGLFLVLGLAACGGSKVDEKKVLEDPEHNCWALHGNFILSDGETVNGWNGKDNDLYEASKMTATSLGDLKAADEAAYKAFVKAGVKYLYKYEGAQFGVNDAGWTANFLNDKGVKYKANGSYVFKAVQLDYDAEEEVYAESLWIPDPHKAHGECVTGNMFFPVWQETKDDRGFSWSDNPVVTGGAGKYTIYVAQYKRASSADAAGFGFALIKTQAATGGQEYVEVPEFVPANHTYGLIGLGGNWATDSDALVGEGSGPYVVTRDFAADDTFKVRADGGWDYNWGFADATAPEGVIENANGNIKIKVAGRYQVSLSFKGEVGSITITAA